MDTTSIPLPALLQNVLTERNVTLAGITVLIFEHLITFADEVRIIWKNKITGVTALFLFNRYFSLAGFLLVLYFKFIPLNAPISCSNAAIFSAVLALVNQVSIVVTLVLRTYALYHRHRTVLAVTSVFGLYCVGQLFYAIFHMRGGSLTEVFAIPVSDIGGLDFCVAEDRQQTSYILSMTSIILFDFLIFGLTIGRTLHTLKVQPELRTLSPLHVLLMRDGSMYFLVMAFVNLISFSSVWRLTDFRLIEVALGSNSILGALFSAVLLSRLILNLRTENERACRGSLPTMPLSTLSYPSPSRLVAPRFLGNLTADVREGDEGEDEAELDSAVTYDGFRSERDEPESRIFRNGDAQMGQTDLYFAGRDTEKTTV